VLLAVVKGITGSVYPMSFPSFILSVFCVSGCHHFDCLLWFFPRFARGCPGDFAAFYSQADFLSSRVNRNIHMKEIYKQLQDRISSRTRS